MSKKENKPVFGRDCLSSLKRPPQRFSIKDSDYPDFYVRSITAAERHKLTELNKDGKPDPKAFEKTVILGVCDEAGEPLFTDGDLDALAQLPNDLVMAMTNAVQSYNVISEESIEAARGN